MDIKKTYKKVIDVAQNISFKTTIMFIRLGSRITGIIIILVLLGIVAAIIIEHATRPTPEERETGKITNPLRKDGHCFIRGERGFVLITCAGF